jgi:hypothetical protein
MQPPSAGAATVPLEPLPSFTKAVAVLSPSAVVALPSAGKAEIHQCPASSQASSLVVARYLLRLDLFHVFLPRCTGASSPLVPQSEIGQGSSDESPRGVRIESFGSVLSFIPHL